MKKRMKTHISIFLVATMLITMVFNLSAGVAQAGTSVNTDYVKRHFHQVEIINGEAMSSFTTSFGGEYTFEDDDDDMGEPNNAASDAAQFNAFPLFYKAAFGGGVTGVSVTSIGEELDPEDSDIEFNQTSINRLDGHFIGKIKVADIPELKKLAESGTARFMVKAGILNSSSSNNAQIWVYTDKQNRSGDALGEHDGTAKIGWDGSPSKWTDVSYSDDDDDKLNVNSPWLSFAPDDYIILETETNSASTEVNGIRLYFADIDAPMIKDYTFTTTGTERDNTEINQKELFLKKEQNFNLTYNFSEYVRVEAPEIITNNLASHNLFMNPAGTGLPGAGQNQSMKLDLTSEQSKEYTKTLPYKYTAADYHHTGNLPIDAGGDLEQKKLNASGSLWEKIDASKFHDAAGNPLKMDGFNKSSSSSSSYLAGKTINPFDYGTNLGYRVIIDAVPPKYSSVANGIQPEIVTGSTLNKGDVINFKVQLTEDAIVKEGDNWNANGLYLLFNNGMKAEYVEGENTSVWRFRATITESDLDVSLLKAIALTHRLKSGGTDKGVIQDYAGNLLMDSANVSPSTNTDPSQAVPNTKIDWANLAIDNKAPKIDFRYDSGVTDAVYKQVDKLTIDANDEAIITPPLDPDEPGAVRPSRGIYHPINMTGSKPEDSSGVGLVYYYWSQSERNPLEGKEADHYAAIKRFSLTGEKPSSVLYPSEMSDFEPVVANNKTNLLIPPMEAFEPANSGAWYLHTWTADMTWDTARELMQYDKMKTYKVNNPAQYTGWINEFKTQNPTGSEADAEKYASDKALVAVGNYKDTSVWKLEDFKQDDSNWTYARGILLLDNESPELSAAVSGGNNTAEVKVAVTAEDKHSGIDPAKLQYQWVKVGERSNPIAWKVVPEDRSVSTLNNVDEAGEYELHLMAVDKAGNQTITQMADTVHIDPIKKIIVDFSPAASVEYVQSHDVTFSIKGISVAELTYAYSPSPALPPTVSYHVYGSSTVTEDVYYFTINKNAWLNGVQYLHIKVKEQGTNDTYNYSEAYHFDNAAPLVTFSKTGGAYPKPSHIVDVTVRDTHSPNAIITKYQWVKSGDTLPDKASVNWKVLPEDNKAMIDNTNLAEGEAAEYTLYVYAQDAAGNDVIKNTDTFMVTREANKPIEVLQKDLIYMDGNESDGYYAIVKLELKNISKEGFEFAISSDGGTTWNPWLPYSNFSKIKVQSAKVQDFNLRVKFKSALGTVSDVSTIDTSEYAAIDEPIYGLAVHSTLKPAKSNVLRISVPAGIKVSPASSTNNPMVPVRKSGNNFEVTINGLYTFDLTDTMDSTKTEKLMIVVKNIDNTPPTADFIQKITEPTTANVLVRLDPSEDVRILNNEARADYLFKDNGTFTFQFEDEAGNQGSATATVTNIDRSQPNVEIVKSYTYGEHGSKSFKTITDSDDNVMYTQGVTLSVLNKDPDDPKQFIVVNGKQQITVYDNGPLDFIITDALGNTTLLQENVTNIVPNLPDPERITYEFIDEQGNLVPEGEIVTSGGKRYAKGKVRATIIGKVDAPNQVFRGTVPVKQGAAYSNLISNETGSYTTSMVYGANGEIRVALSDLLGNINRPLIKVEGLDNTAPVIKLNSSFVAVVQNQENFNPLVDLGGYSASDNLSETNKLKVTVENLDISKLGKQTVTYTVTDEVGNTSSVKQNVVVLANSGLLIIGNDQVISSATGESILFDQNHVTFGISGFNVMNVDGQSVMNERGRYDILYHSGLYREGQMKYIAQQVTMEQLLSHTYKVEFPETGWYTIIVRTQEREREFATFFISKLKK
ncbi:hypothetical protein [Paenibacillus oryzisoli]|uniref:HYR domain-containing protein n=1 Tax=Paenibacillus oryzisoli TaxID=1850517 RepID=A0A198A8B2_9BACL|nr:hypothetical protein [Paenibacillus oryzisoli]OAS17704.1 hypothetical protein A8708_14510 [Paenibacillus oryzisoli]